MQRQTLFRSTLMFVVLALSICAPRVAIAGQIAPAEQVAVPAALPNLQVNQWSFGGGFAVAGVALGDDLNLDVANESDGAVPAGYTIRLYISVDPIITAARSDDYGG